MSCARNKIAVANEEELTKIFNNKNTAENLIRLNGGYSLEYTKEGNLDILYSKLLMVYNFNKTKALTTKAIIKLDTLNTILTFDKVLSKLSDIKGIDVTKIDKTALHTNIIKDVIRIAKTMDSSVKYVEGKIITDKNNADIIKKLNDYYGVKIVTSKANHITIQTENMQSVINKDITNSMDSNNVNQTNNENSIGKGSIFDNYTTSYLFGNKNSEDKSNTKYDNYKDYINAISNQLKSLQKRKSLLQVRMRMIKDRNEGKAINSIIVRLNSDIRNLKMTLNNNTNEEKLKKEMIQQLNSFLSSANNIVKNIKLKENTEDINELKKLLDIIDNAISYIKIHWTEFYENKDNKLSITNITDRLSNIKQKLDEKTINLAVRTITNVSEENKTTIKDRVLSLLESQLPDIDLISEYTLNPLFSFNMKNEANTDNLGQAIVVYYMQNVLKTNAYAKSNIESIDSMITDLRSKGKLDYTMFYQKDKNGNLTPYLIHPFTQEFEKIKATILSNLRISINSIHNTKGSKILNEQIELEKAYNNIKNIGEFLNPAIIPEIKQEFKQKLTTLLPVDIFGFGQNSYFNDDTLINSYKSHLVSLIGEHSYNYLVNSQLKKIDTFLNIFENKKQELFKYYNLDENSNIRNLPPEGILQLQNIVAEMSPFHYNVHSKDGFIPVGNNAVHFNIENAEIIPNDAKYHDKDFDSILNDKDQYKFWKILFDSTRYINDVAIITGNKNVTFNSLFDMSKSIAEEINNNKHSIIQRYDDAYKTLKDKIKNGIAAYSKALVENNDKDVINNRSLKPIRNTIAKESSIELSAVSDLFKKLKQFTRNSDEYDINAQNLTNYVLRITGKQFFINPFDIYETKKIIDATIVKNAEQRVMEQQSLDLGKVIKFYIAQAARIEASQNSIPVVNMLRALYSGINSPKGEIRHRAVQRLDAWIDRTVRLNYSKNETGKGFGNIRTEELKRLEKRAQRAYDATGDKDYLNKVKIEVRKFTVATAINAGIQYVMFNTMVSNILSGIGNRIYGIQQNRFIDATGRYWTTGNDDKTSLFITDFKLLMIEPIIRKLSDNDKKKGYLRRLEQIKKANLLFNKLGIIQDMRNESQKASSSIGKLSSSDKLNPFYLSITRPELRNQGGTILNVLMDERIQDNDRNWSKIFDGKQFLIYDNINSDNVKIGDKYVDSITGKKLTSKGGKLVLKPNFRNQRNIANWETFDGSLGIKFKVKALVANMIVQGDYSPFGGNMLKDMSVGKALSVFLTYLPMVFHNRYGSGSNIITGKTYKKSVYGQVGTGAITPLAITFGMAHLGVLPTTVIGMAGVTYAGVKAMQRGEFNKQLLTHANALLDSINIFKMIGEHMLNTPINFVTRGVFRNTNRTPIKFNSIDSVNMINKQGYDVEQIHAMRALAHDMAIRAEFLMATALIFGAFYCDDDTDHCKKMKKLRNVLTNFLWMLSDNFAVFDDPIAFVNQITQRGAFMLFLTKIAKVGYDISELLVKGIDSDIILAGDNRGKSKIIEDTKKLLLPSIMRGTGLATNLRGGSRIFKEQEGDALMINQIESVLMSPELKTKRHILAKRAKYSHELEKTYKRGSKEFKQELNKKIPTVSMRKRNYIWVYGIDYYSTHKDKFYKEVMKGKTWARIK